MKLVEVVWHALWMLLFMAALIHSSWILAVFSIGMIAFSFDQFARADLPRARSFTGFSVMRLRRLARELAARFKRWDESLSHPGREHADPRSVE
jgi:hypothetical protein